MSLCNIHRYLVGVPGKIGIQGFDYSDRHCLVALENGKVSSYLCEMTRNTKGKIQSQHNVINQS